MKKLLLIILFTTSFTYGQNTYWVTLSGSNGNNGLSEGNAFRTLVYANNKMSNGDTLYIKKGNYGNDRPVINKDNVTWIGYSTTPGDLDRQIGDGPLWDYESQAFSNTRYPTITATDQLTQRCMDISGNNVTIKNFQVTEGTFGFNFTGNNPIADNLSVYEIGDTNGGEGSGATGLNQYSIGIRFRGNNSTIRNSVVVNVTGEGITFRGTSRTSPTNGHIADHCKVFSDKTTAQNGCDYFILLFEVDNSIVSNCHVEQRNDTNSGRHGLSIKSGGTGNIFENSTTSGVNIEANFAAVTGNIYKNITINGRFSAGAGTGGKISIANGANNNLFENIKLIDCRYGISFADWDDGAEPGGNSAGEFGGGNDNDLVNIVLIDVRSAVHFSFFQALSTANDNRIFNLTVHNSDRLVEADMANSGTKFYNILLDDVTTLISGSDTTLNSNTIFSYVNVRNSFDTSAFTPYAENNITSTTFSFTNEVTNDYTITTSAMDIGQDLSGIFAPAAFDFNGNTRTTPYTMGAFEFNGGPPVGDVTAPVIVSHSVLSVTETTFRLDWTVDEGSKGRVRYGASPGVYTFETSLEDNYLTRHIQTVGGNNAPLLNPNTTYFYQYYLEDVTGNFGYSSEFSQTTLSSGEPTPPSPVTTQDLRGKFLKIKKLF